MKDAGVMSERINQYELLSPFQNNNAGFSRWAIAKKNSKKYFLKELINPKYPDEDSLSETLRGVRIKECRDFEEKRALLYSTVNDASDGNLVRIEEFFRADSHYYVSSRWIDDIRMNFTQIASLDLKDKLLICRTAAHSLACLHEKHVVHADIKDTNVLLHKTQAGCIVSKIIDFDTGFFESDPPCLEDDLGGDQVYLSPEACQFICGDEVALTCKMDVFALGLLFHQYFTGSLPCFDSGLYNYAHEAVLDDVILRADSADIPLPVQKIIESMLLCDPEKRISSREVYLLLTAFSDKLFPTLRPLESAMSRSEDRQPGSNRGANTSSRLRMSSDFFKHS